MLTRNPDSARGNDLYETPEVATLALLRAEPLPRTIWGPDCGPDAIVRVLRSASHRVIATDLIDYRSPDQDHAGRDFLLERRAPDGGEMIITNPPFKLAVQFAGVRLSLALQHGSEVATIAHAVARDSSGAAALGAIVERISTQKTFAGDVR